MTQKKPPAERNYEVGKGKPPKHTQFPHQKSNRKGKPKGARDWSTLLNDELDLELQMEEGERPIRISKRALLIKSLVNKAAKGDLKAVELIIRLSAGRNENAAVDLHDITPEMITSYLRRMQAGGSEQ